MRVISLQALAGHLDSPGGRHAAAAGPGPAPSPSRRPRPSSPTAARPSAPREFPVFHEVRNEAHGALLPRAILEGEPYPVRGMIVSGSSLLTSWPNPARWREALAALDLLVVVNRFETADAAYADLLLPATTMFEIESIAEYEGHVELRRKVIEPPGEARNDYLIFAELAERLGYGDRWPQTERGLVETALIGTGISYDELAAAPDGLPLPRAPHVPRKWERGLLRDDATPGFRTPSGRFEFASEWLRSHGHEALPVYTEPIEGPLASPELARAYPLVLNTGARIKADFRSQHRNIPSLSAMQPAPQVHLHADDAAARGIADGDEVLVVSPRGSVPFRARVDHDIAPGVVEANMGGGGPLGPVAWRERERQRADGPRQPGPDLRLPGLQGAVVRRPGRIRGRRCLRGARAGGRPAPPRHAPAGWAGARGRLRSRPSGRREARHSPGSALAGRDPGRDRGRGLGDRSDRPTLPGGAAA